MRFGYAGVRYQEAPLAVREQVSFTDSKKIELCQQMQRIGVEQCMVLSTCNRSEIFFFCPEKMNMVAVKECYSGIFPGVKIAPYLQSLEDRDAMEYLFRVTAGLESLVLGEDQILGQVGDAIDFSRTMGFAGKELNKVVRDAITCAKNIKTTFRISETPLSVSYVGIRELKKISSIEGKNVLVIGSGKTASLALTYLYECGAQQIFVCSRNRSHAGRLKQSFPKLQVRDYEDRYQLMEHCSIVVSATASPHIVVREKEVMNVLKKREGGIVFLDLAAPRDIEEGLERLAEVEIINLDTLQRICSDNRKLREELATKSSFMIEESVAETEEWLRVSRMDETIESLQRRCSRIVEDSFSYLDRKLVLEYREKKIVKKVLNASLQRLIREPIQELKQLDTIEEQNEYKKMVEQLFRIER